MICHGRDGIALIDQSTLVGRELELETLAAFLDGVSSAAGTTLLIEGEPGARPAAAAVAAMLAWAITCLAYPHSAGALGPAWASLAITWAVAFGVAAGLEVHGERSE